MMRAASRRSQRGSIELVTGVPGAGKTLLTVWRRLRPLVGAKIEHKAADGSKSEVPVRLMVGGIPELLLEHQPLAVPHIRWDSEGSYDDVWTGVMRKPGEPALDWVQVASTVRKGQEVATYKAWRGEVTPEQEAEGRFLRVERRADNWWLWCEPGDFITIDEAWQCFGTFPAGRKMPDFISKLAIHRHYGVSFVLIGQAPTQFHIFVRGLVEKHQFIRRMFGSSRLVVYEWDHCANHTSTKTGTKSLAKHDPRAFSLYRSSQLHIKPKHRIPVSVLMLVVALVVTPVTWWNVFHRSKSAQAAQAQHVDQSQEPAHVAPPASPASAPLHYGPVGKPAFVTAVVPRGTWPDALAGCWQDDTGCHCMTQEAAPRIVRDRPALCAAVVAGDLEPPITHVRPVRTQPEAALHSSDSASSPSV